MRFLYPETLNYQFMHARPQQMLKALSRLGHETIFVNKNDVKLQGAEKVLHSTEVEPNHYVIPPWIDLKQFNPFILFYMFPPQHKLISELNPDKIIFDVVDEPAGVFRFWNVGNSWEKSLLKADYVIATSAKLFNDVYHYREDVHYIPNGCEYEHFATPMDMPPEFLCVDEMPIITYCGSVATWVDLELLYETAEAFPECMHFVIGANQNASLKTDLPPNMKYLGHKPYQELPGYLQHSDVLLIPFKPDDEVIAATNPVKLWEYLATGRPIVTTEIPECEGIPGVYHTTNNYDWAKSIEAGLKEPRKSIKSNARRKKAKANSWEVRAKKLLRVLEE